MRFLTVAIPVAFVLGTMFAIESPSPVLAVAGGKDLAICNKTKTPLNDVAIGYYSSGPNDATGSRTLTGPFVSTGWFSIAPGECGFYDNPFNARYMFWWGAVRGTMNDSLTGDNTWTAGGDAYFCIPNLYGAPGDAASTFTFEEENSSRSACESNSANPKIGPNVWVHVRRVDLDVNPQVDFEGS